MTQNNPFRAGLSESQMWAQYNAVYKRLERAQNGRINLAYKEWCNLVRLEGEMRRYLNDLVWGDYEPLNIPKTKDEKIAGLMAMNDEKKHLLFLCDLQKHFASANMCEKSCDKTWAFEREFNSLKSYKQIHGWDRAYIMAHLGVDFNELKKTYYRLRK